MQCRICLEESELSLLIEPCLCKGSMAYVHPHCLQRWHYSLGKYSKNNQKQDFRCGSCLAPLKISFKQQQRRTFLRATNTQLISFILITLVVGAAGYVFGYMDKSSRGATSLENTASCRHILLNGLMIIILLIGLLPKTIRRVHIIFL